MNARSGDKVNTKAHNIKPKQHILQDCKAHDLLGGKTAPNRKFIEEMDNRRHPKDHDKYAKPGQNVQYKLEDGRQIIDRGFRCFKKSLTVFLCHHHNPISTRGCNLVTEY